MIVQDPNKIVLAAKKKNKLRIAVDIDGVLSYWEKAAAETCGVDYEDEKIREEMKNGKRMEEFVGGDSKMWPMIDKEGESWWENMEKTPWADDLVALLKKESKDFFFLSSPSKSPICYSGKIKWILKNYPKLDRNLFLLVNYRNWLFKTWDMFLDILCINWIIIFAFSLVNRNIL